MAPDQVRRSFQTERPKQLWVADATYIPTSEGTLYFAAIQEVFSRRVVGWSRSPKQECVINFVYGKDNLIVCTWRQSSPILDLKGVKI